MQALQNTQKLQEATKFSGIAAVLGTAYLLGQGTDLLSVPVAASLILGAASVVASKKLQQLEKHFGFLDWDHTEH